MNNPVFRKHLSLKHTSFNFRYRHDCVKCFKWKIQSKIWTWFILQDIKACCPFSNHYNTSFVK